MQHQIGLPLSGLADPPRAPCPGFAGFLQVRKQKQSHLHDLAKVTRQVGPCWEQGLGTCCPAGSLPACDREMGDSLLPSWPLNETYFMENCRWTTWTFFPEKLSAQISSKG